jgi:methionyl-tRNA formyltransferase
MFLKDVAMIAANTSRTHFYLKELIKFELLPTYLLLLNNENKNLPGQSTFNDKEFFDLLSTHKIQFEIAPNIDINSDSVKKLVKERAEKIFIFSGFGGVILKDKILETGKKFLHVHGGYLPMYKGSTTNYFSLLDDNSMGASSIFLNNRIDSGPVLVRRKFPPPDNRKKIDHIYDSEIRSKVLVETLLSYKNSGVWSFDLENNTGGETFFIIHPVLKHIAILG